MSGHFGFAYLDPTVSNRETQVKTQRYRLKETWTHNHWQDCYGGETMWYKLMRQVDLEEPLLC